MVKLAEAGPSSPRGVAWPRIRAGNGGPGTARGTAVLRTKARCGAALCELDWSGGRWSDACSSSLCFSAGALLAALPGA
eukprot:7500235-Alexandrium_andersonii.AAC.1